MTSSVGRPAIRCATTPIAETSLASNRIHHIFFFLPDTLLPALHLKGVGHRLPVFLEVTGARALRLVISDTACVYLIIRNGLALTIGTLAANRRTEPGVSPRRLECLAADVALARPPRF